MSSLYAMPVLFLSLGAELLFIVQQSLVQQNVPTAKKSTVLDGMICTMFDESFIAEIFEPQRTFSQTSMMGLFNRIAHSSTMRLNSGSKGAIHDRMNIALKHMAILVESPANLANCVLLLLEQLSGICSSPRTRELLASIRYRFLEFAASMTPMDWVSIRQTILRFTHQPAGPRKIDQLFCAEGIQADDGTFFLKRPVPAHGVPVGTWKVFDVRAGVINEGHAQLSKVATRADYWSTHPDELGTNYRSPTRTKYTGTTPKRVELVHRL